MFAKIEIEIDLSEEGWAKMPKSGPEEMAAIDAHSLVIEKTTEGLLDEVRQGLEALGYKISVNY